MVSRQEFSTRDPERALPVLGEFFPALKLSSPREDFAFEMASAEVESFALVHYHLLSPNSSSSVDTAGQLTIGQVESGGVSMTMDRRQIDTSQPWVFPQGPVAGDWDEVTITALSLSIPAMLRFARAQLGDDGFRLVFSGPSPVDPALGRQWATLVDYTRAALSEDGSLMLSELVRANAFSHLAAMLLATFPSNFLEALERPTAERAMPRAVRIAIQYMEENAHRPITVEEVAREARMSIRGLQYAFRSSLDTTPMARLRDIRLAGAHEDLRQADPLSGVTVAAIAVAWGFDHPGRFAKRYRSIYGTSPRQTLES